MSDSGLKVLSFNAGAWIRQRYSGVIVERPAKVEDLCSYAEGTITVGDTTCTFDSTYFDDASKWKQDNTGYQICLDAYKMRQKVEKLTAFVDCPPEGFTEEEMAAWLDPRSQAWGDTIQIPWSDLVIEIDSTWFLQDIDCQDDFKTGISRVTGTWKRDGAWFAVKVDGETQTTTTT